MNEVLNPTSGKHTFPTPLISVEIDQNLLDAGVRVFFSKFSVPSGIVIEDKDEAKMKVLRGIANVNFTYPGGKEESKVTLKVYVTKDELENGKIFALKSGGWKLLGGDATTDKQGPWEGFLKTTMPLGDPPIAVG